jgi:HTH-type transcriptional regulator / antitoxin HigA
MREIEELTIRGVNRSAAETECYRVLCALVSDYERRVGADRWHKLAPIEALRELMELEQITQAEVADALGDRAATSSILSGRRQISKTQAKKLGELFRVDAGVFI